MASGQLDPTRMNDTNQTIVDSRMDSSVKSNRFLEGEVSSRRFSLLENRSVSRKSSLLEHHRELLEREVVSRRLEGLITGNKGFHAMSGKIEDRKGLQTTIAYKEGSQNASRYVTFLESSTATRILERECLLEGYLQLIQMKRGFYQ